VNESRVRRLAGEGSFSLIVTIVVLVAVFPFYWILATSLETNRELSLGTHGLWPATWTVQSYLTLLAQYNFLIPLANSALVAAATTLISLVAGMLTAYGLVRVAPRARVAMLGFILATALFPVIAMVGLLFFVYRDLGLLDNHLALIVTYLIYALPITVWMLVSILGQIPRDMEEAGMVDGATTLQVLWRILLPLALPGVFTAAILSFILSWNDFIFALSFTTDPARYTTPLAIVNLGQSQYQVFYNIIDAGVVITTIPIVILVLIAQRRIIAGLLAGSLKG
jgi:ABC-type glycerol-3-phosphate transport system permease component